MAAKPYPFYGLLCLETAAPTPGPMPVSSPGASPAQRILPELHLNIWEKGEWIFGEQAFIDIGLMLDVNEAAKSYEFLVPWAVKDEHLEDLSDRIFYGRGAVPAIFNEAWPITTGNGGAEYVTDPATNQVLFTIVKCQSELKTRRLVHDGRELVAITIDIGALRAKSLKVKVQTSRMYVRFRIRNVPKEFYRVGIDQKDRMLLSSWQRTEILDFRLNVRRGIPIALDQDVGGSFVEFAKVHLFLMKSREHDIVFEDSLFKACRSLEDEKFWAEYSWPKDAKEFVKWWTKKRVKRSLGYQWSKLEKVIPVPAHTQSPTSPTYTTVTVKEFGILARFKEVRFGIKKFVFIALIVGALGNALWDAMKFRYEDAGISTTVQGWLARSPQKGEEK